MTFGQQQVAARTPSARVCVAVLVHLQSDSVINVLHVLYMCDLLYLTVLVLHRLAAQP
jgi:hypothetical protein